MELKGSPPKPLNTTFDNNSPQISARLVAVRRLLSGYLKQMQKRIIHFQVWKSVY